MVFTEVFESNLTRAVNRNVFQYEAAGQVNTLSRGPSPRSEIETATKDGFQRLPS